MKKHVPFTTLVGMTLKSITHDIDTMEFINAEGRRFRLFHDQDCCESVEIEDICGDLNDLIGYPILVAEERTSTDEEAKDRWDESYTWTFYELRTIKGSVTIRWYGTSNGYYSEDVDFVEILDIEGAV
ncbi:hypothetical protein LJC59_00855 [Desulfovibrio sp. OttesenSCG-928-A18]|nr:hypothetical protein [Desulfovibrio sp. OttesenSCG-928-A18]